MHQDPGLTFVVLLTLKNSFPGNVKVYCRTRPLFEDEGPSLVEFPDDVTIRVNTRDESLTNPKKDYEFDRVYGPHVGQGMKSHFFLNNSVLIKK